MNLLFDRYFIDRCAHIWVKMALGLDLGLTRWPGAKIGVEQLGLGLYLWLKFEVGAKTGAKLGLNMGLGPKLGLNMGL